jgi:hypothetical protein
LCPAAKAVQWRLGGDAGKPVALRRITSIRSKRPDFFLRGKTDFGLSGQIHHFVPATPPWPELSVPGPVTKAMKADD